MVHVTQDAVLWGVLHENSRKKMKMRSVWGIRHTGDSGHAAQKRGGDNSILKVCVTQEAVLLGMLLRRNGLANDSVEETHDIRPEKLWTVLQKKGVRLGWWRRACMAVLPDNHNDNGLISGHDNDNGHGDNANYTYGGHIMCLMMCPIMLPGNIMCLMMRLIMCLIMCLIMLPGNGERQWREFAAATAGRTRQRRVWWHWGWTLGRPACTVAVA